MHPAIKNKLRETREICRNRSVSRLHLFGSGTGTQFDPKTSDIDFVVEFKPLTPGEHANQYFGLQEDLENLFKIPIDLIEEKPVENPYFLAEIRRTKIPIYE